MPKGLAADGLDKVSGPISNVIGAGRAREPVLTKVLGPERHSHLRPVGLGLVRERIVEQGRVNWSVWLCERLIGLFHVSPRQFRVFSGTLRTWGTRCCCAYSLNSDVHWGCLLVPNAFRFCVDSVEEGLEAWLRSKRYNSEKTLSLHACMVRKIACTMMQPGPRVEWGPLLSSCRCS